MNGDAHDVPQTLEEYRNHLLSVARSYVKVFSRDGTNSRDDHSHTESVSGGAAGTEKTQEASDILENSLLQQVNQLSSAERHPDLCWLDFQTQLKQYLTMSTDYASIKSTEDHLVARFQDRLKTTFGKGQARTSALEDFKVDCLNIRQEGCSEMLRDLNEVSRILSDTLIATTVDGLENPPLSVPTAKGYVELKHLPTKEQLDTIIQNGPSALKTAREMRLSHFSNCSGEVDDYTKRMTSIIKQTETLIELAKGYRSVNKSRFASPQPYNRDGTNEGRNRFGGRLRGMWSSKKS